MMKLLVLAASHVGNTLAISSLFPSKAAHGADAIAVTEDVKSIMAEVLNSTEVKEVLKKSEKLRKARDFVADSVYVGLELRAEASTYFSPGVEASFFWAQCTDYATCQNKCKICLAVEGGAEYDIDEAWGIAKNHNVEASLMVGGAALDELPTGGFGGMIPSLEFGGGTQLPYDDHKGHDHDGPMVDGIVTKNLKSKRYALMGVEIVPTGTLAKAKEALKNMTHMIPLRDKALEMIESLNNPYFGEELEKGKAHADAEVHAGGTLCWPIKE